MSTSTDRDDEDLEMSNMKLLEEDVVAEKDTPLPRSLRAKALDGACIILNITSTVTLVFLNNWYFPRSYHADRLLTMMLGF
jgi:solute carrier family 35 protein E3